MDMFLLFLGGLPAGLTLNFRRQQTGYGFDGFV
jgi:hypothetical protein